MKNIVWRVVAVLMVIVLITSCAISSTFAKYVTTGGDTASARVAKWGVTVDTNISTLFKGEYDFNVDGNNEVVTCDTKNVVAPGAYNEISFTMKATGTPEVACKFSTTAKVTFSHWEDKDGKYYCPLIFTINGEKKSGTEFTGPDEFATWVEGRISTLSAEFLPLTNLAEVCDKVYIDISWEWPFEVSDENNVKDTYLGNKAANNNPFDDPVVDIIVYQTIEQIQEFEGIPVHSCLDEDENCKCDICAEPCHHFEDSERYELCQCAVCREFVHTYDENCECVVCHEIRHDFNSDTGICGKCDNFIAMSSITVNGIKTYYENVNDAANVASQNENCVIVVESDGEKNNGTVNITSGNVTIDLNGKTLAAWSNYAITPNGGNVTIKDSVGGGKVEGNLCAGWTKAGTLTIEEGDYTSVSTAVFTNNGGNLIIKGGEFRSVYINDKNGSLTISGGSFETLRTFREYHSLQDLLADGCCYYDANGDAVDLSQLTFDGNWAELNNVTVGKIK